MSKSVGKSVTRVDAYEKATGRAKYVADLCDQSALVARILHATIAHGYVKSIDTTEAEAVPGVVKVLTCFNVPDYRFPTAGHPWSTDPAHQDVADRLLLNRHVRYYGDDIAAVIAENERWLADTEAIGVVEANAARNGAVCEKHAREALAARFDVPIVLASELTSDLNMMERGATALLNARLLPLIEEFLASVRRSLAARGVTASIAIVRSDGSLMSEAFAGGKPVETILSGPAASILGSRELADRETCLVIDMGGTTTDVSIVVDGRPALTDRIRIGSWKTQVRGAYVETFGLGGDSAVRVVKGELSLSERRLEPISAAAQRWPRIKELLRRRCDASPCAPWATSCEGLFLVRQPNDRARYTAAELQIVDELAAGPALIGDGIKVDRHIRTTERLEAEGVLMRFGFTPTDAMHLAGDFDRYDREAALLAARIMNGALGAGDDPEGKRLATRVYRLVEKKLYANLVRILIRNRYPKTSDAVDGGAFDEAIEADWLRAVSGADDPLFDLRFSTKATLVGVGAPSRLFVPAVARLLDAECAVPDSSEVANAVGAASATISARASATVVPRYDAFGIVGYIVHTPDGRRHAAREDEAVSLAEDAAHEAVHTVGLAVDDARLDGLGGVAAYRGVRILELDRGEPVGVREQRRGRGLDARRDDAARERAVAVDHLDIGRGAEIDHDDGLPVQGARRHGVGDAVRADLGGIGVRGGEQLLAGGVRRADERVCPHQLAQGGSPSMGELGHHRGERGAPEAIRPDTLRREQRHELKPQLVGGVVLVGGDAPHVAQLLAIVHADDRLGVPHINRKQHLWQLSLPRLLRRL